MQQSLYDILGISPDADSAEVKKAYRKKAQKLHPDKEEGDKEAFQKVIAAYEVLIDEHKRKQYDEDGTIENDVGKEHHHLRELVAVLFALIDKVQDVEHYNLILESKRVVNGGIEKARNAIEDLKDSIETRKEVLKRLTCKNGPNMLAAAVESDIAKREVGVLNMEENIKVGQDLLTLLDDYEYRVDIVTEPTGFFQIGTQGYSMGSGTWRGR